MKERFYPELAEGLTNIGQSFHNEGRGDVFMAENQVEAPTNGSSSEQPSGQPEAPKAVETETKPQKKEGERVPQEKIERARKAWEAANKNTGKRLTLDEIRNQERLIKRGILPMAGGAVAAEQRRGIFEGIKYPTLTEEQRQSTSEEEQRAFQERVGALRPYIEAISRADRAGFLNPQEAFQELNNAIGRGEIDSVMAERYFDILAARGLVALREQARMRRGENPLIPLIREAREDERTQAIKEAVNQISADLTSIDQELLHLIAQDPEGAEFFLDKIISKPFSAPEAHYELSFYANINLQAFLTEVNVVDKERYLKYVHKKEATLRFHEMNRTIISESGNIDAFLGITRTVTPRHLQTATEEDGVEIVRQLIEMAYGRLYAKTNRVTGDNFDPEIIEWTEAQFYQICGYVRNSETRKWEYRGGEKTKSKYNRPFEDWEIARALAFGRNIHTSFYRHSELISWSNIPPMVEEWIKSVPTETVVRVLAGLKWLSYRFRIGRGKGTRLVNLIYDKLTKSYRDTLEKEGGLAKIGKLDIVNDLIPVGFFKGGGFDKGWRTLVSYLDSDIMRITIPDPENFPEEVRGEVENFIAEFGRQGNLGTFLFRQEYRAQIASSQAEKIAGVDVRPELRRHDSKKQAAIVEKVLFELRDQLNLSLGVLISYGGSNEKARAMLWEKTARFLPLRIAYLLSEEGVKEKVEGYADVRGEGESLFSDEFETRLIQAQRLRLEEQKRRPREEVELSDRFLDAVGCTEPEKNFVRRLKAFGQQKAKDLAKVQFPHIPFLDDVPFQEANYIKLGAEVFPRRMGGDFRAFFECNNALNATLSNIGQPYEEIMKNLETIVNNMSTPEDKPTGQTIVFPILQSWLELAKQWTWTRIPFVKTILNFVGQPTSELQKMYGTNAPSDDETELNIKARSAVEKDIMRREKLPGEDKAQIDDLLESVGGKWYHVFWRELRNALVIYFMLMVLKFGEKTAKEKT